MNSGRPKFGTTQEEKGLLDYIDRLARRRRDGSSPTAYKIARELNECGYKSKSGKKWTGQAVKNILIRLGRIDGKKNQKRRVKKTVLSCTDYISRGQIEACMKACLTMRDRMIFWVLAAAGLRAAEIIALQVRDLGITGGKCQIDVRRGKGSRQRSVYIPKELAAALKVFTASHGSRKAPVFTSGKGGQLTYGALYKLVKTVGKRAGISELHPHVLRHSFATILYDNKKDLLFVAQQLGHAWTDTTKIYAKVLNNDKLEQLSVFAGLGTAQPVVLKGKESICKLNLSALEDGPARVYI